MTTAVSRDVLDWLRSYVEAKTLLIGETVISSNMNLPLTSNVRVQAAIDYLATIEAEIRADPDWDVWGEYWSSSLDEVWAEVLAQMPVEVRDAWFELWNDPDSNATGLLKAAMRTTELLVMRAYGRAA